MPSTIRALLDGKTYLPDNKLRPDLLNPGAGKTWPALTKVPACRHKNDYMIRRLDKCAFDHKLQDGITIKAVRA